MVTVLAILVSDIPYPFTLRTGTNIQNMSSTSKFCHHHLKIVTNNKSSTSWCHHIRIWKDNELHFWPTSFRTFHHHTFHLSKWMWALEEFRSTSLLVWPCTPWIFGNSSDFSSLKNMQNSNSFDININWRDISEETLIENLFLDFETGLRDYSQTVCK